jgi:hypothetical protein
MRITKEDLENSLAYLNEFFNDRLFILDGAYGGYALHCLIENDTTKRTSITSHMPKRELFARIDSMADGISFYKRSTNKPL